MFTGLVAARGTLADREERGAGARLAIHTPMGRIGAGQDPLALGESISVDGACLSVVEVLPEGFTMDATVETLARTTLGTLALGHEVNLERAVRAGDRLGGHIVTGHVDAVGRLARRRAEGEALAMSFTLPRELARLVAEKGSIAINGVSMTVNAVTVDGFDVMVIPITQRETNLGTLAAGDPVNLEVDLVARYVARLLGGERASAGEHG
jgi:riboflavin synthase